MVCKVVTYTLLALHLSNPLYDSQQVGYLKRLCSISQTGASLLLDCFYRVI